MSVLAPVLFTLLSILGMTPATAAPAPIPSATPQAELSSLLDEDLDAVLRRGPLQATVRGIPGYNHLLPEVSLAELERERARERRALERLRALDAKAMRGQDRVSWELLLDKMEVAVETQRFAQADPLILTTLGGVHTLMPRAAQVTPFRTLDDYRDYVQRLRGMPKLAADTIARLEPGIASGWMSTAGVVDRIVAAIDAHLVDDAATSPLMAPFAKPTGGVDAASLRAVADDARRAIADDYQPALRRYREFLVGAYRPKAPAAAGLASMPGGAAYYEFLIRSRVVRGFTAAQVHELGQSEVRALREEIGKLAREVGFTQGADAFVAALRTDPKYFFASPEAVLAAYRAMAPRVDPLLPKLFHHVPRMPYAVRAMTPAEAASSTAANYQTGSLALGTSGYFTINALGYASEPTWRVETLFLHEAVPGHHMQIARAAEIEGLHPWRSLASFNVAYVEGWALYAESLGYDLGFFRDPYQRYGNLQARLFRAARLVADTGIHAFGWSREKAIDYMSTQGGMDRTFAQSEVDRYFSNPSQALGYMLGYLRVRELRMRAERALGAKFDAKDFHAVLIDQGSMPLAVLERLVDAWIAAGGGMPR